MGDTDIAEVELPGGVQMLVRTQRIDGDVDGPSDVGLRRIFDLSALMSAVRVIAAELHDALKAAQPDQVRVELGFDLAVKGSQLVALLVDGSVTASVKIRLTWGAGQQETQVDVAEGRKSE
jgi:Trypsin-co-occurring domain 1